MDCNNENCSGPHFRIMTLLIVFLLGCLIGAGGLYFKNVREMRKLAQQKLIAEWQSKPVAVSRPAVAPAVAAGPESAAAATRQIPAGKPQKTAVSKQPVKPAAKPAAKQAVLDRKIYDLFVFQPLLNELLKNGNEFFLHAGKGMRQADFKRECNRFIGSMRKLEQLVIRGEIRNPEFKWICRQLHTVEAALTLAWENRDFLDGKGRVIDQYLSDDYILIQLGDTGLFNSPLTHHLITAETEPTMIGEIANEAQAHRTASQILHFFLYGPGRKYCKFETFRKNGRDYQVCHFRQKLIVIQNRMNRAKNLYMVRYDSVAALLAVGEKEFEPIRNMLKRYVR